MQVLLCNPLGLLLYAATTFHFFWDRIPFEVRQSVGRKGTAYALHSTHQLSCTVSEPRLSPTCLRTCVPTYLRTYVPAYLLAKERLLHRFFGDEYQRYCASTWIGIPFLAWAVRRKAS